MVTNDRYWRIRSDYGGTFTIVDGKGMELFSSKDRAAMELIMNNHNNTIIEMIGRREDI